MKITFESDYIYEDQILLRIYNDAVCKFMPMAENNIVFSDLCAYIAKKLQQRKQCVYSNALAIVQEVCKRIGEDFDSGINFYAPNAKNQRDVYFAIY